MFREIICIGLTFGEPLPGVMSRLGWLPDEVRRGVSWFDLVGVADFEPVLPLVLARGLMVGELFG
jgi:hypothetical protein